MAVFKLSGNMPVRKERLRILERGTAISLFKEDKGKLNGPVDLLESKEEIQLDTSIGSVGERKIELGTGF